MRMAQENLSLDNYLHIVWDWNGSLLDDAWLCVEIINELRAEHGMDALSIEAYREIFDFPVRRFYESMGFDVSPDSFETLAAYFIRRYEERRTAASLHPEARETLRDFTQRGLAQSLLSAYRQETLESIIQHWRLDCHFDKMLGLQNHYADGKLENAIRWTQELGVPPRRILFIGDTIHDYEVARACGADCILVEGGHQTRRRLETCGVPVLASLKEIREMLSYES